MGPNSKRSKKKKKKKKHKMKSNVPFFSLPLSPRDNAMSPSSSESQRERGHERGRGNNLSLVDIVESSETSDNVTSESESDREYLPNSTKGSEKRFGFGNVSENFLDPNVNSNSNQMILPMDRAQSMGTHMHRR